MFRPNQRAVLTYPDSTIVETVRQYREREITVEKVRDLVSSPLTVKEYFRRPLIKRGRWLVSGRDPNGRFRQFYLANSVEFQRDSPLRIGIYEPGATTPLEIVSRQFENNRRDRILLGKTISHWACQDLDGLLLGIFADDLRVVADD